MASIVSKLGDKLSALPEPDSQGLTPAVEYDRALLARKIIQRREAVGMSQTALARAAKLRVETLNRLERGKVNPDERTLNKIVRALEKAERVNAGK
jgi:DNA-binding XRE family transcriptional regulator